MNHKAKLLDWDTIGYALLSLQEQKRWADLLLISTACFTGCRPGDWTAFTWNIFLHPDGTAKTQTNIYEAKPNNLAKAKAKSTWKEFEQKKRVIIMLPQFQTILVDCWKGLTEPYLYRNMFTGKFGPKNPRGGISTRTANDRLKSLAIEFGLDPDITNYSFRKTTARKIFDSAKDYSIGLRLAQKFLNHRSPESTAHYIGLSDEELVTAFGALIF